MARPGCRPPSALAVCGQLPEVLLELLRGQLALAVAGEHRLDAQVRAQDHTTIGTTIAPTDPSQVPLRMLAVP
jgi:hypothetical protein